MISPIHESAGMGSPPRIYTTNRNECMNHVARAHVDHRKLELASNMYTLVTDQVKKR